jgi:triphosphoribosyl-dephospho-CoA synthase
LELAILFEISADKPGNVNLTVGFEGTKYEHFLASAVAAAPWFEFAAEKGIAFFRGQTRLSDMRLGSIMRKCVIDVNTGQRGGNTLLGTIILLSPIAVAAGITPFMKGNIFDVGRLRENLKRVVEATTPEDAVDVYEMIRIAHPSGLNKAPDLDVNDPSSLNRIVEERITLLEVFKIASAYDNVCAEWVNNYPITFEVAYPYLTKQIVQNQNLSVAVTHTFLKVLSEYPDSFIARKVGTKRAAEVSAKAKEIIRLGGFQTREGREAMRRFDLELRKSSNVLNPGTTADIIAAALALLVLNGYRP